MPRLARSAFRAQELQCFRDPQRLIRAQLREFSISYANPPRPRCPAHPLRFFVSSAACEGAPDRDRRTAEDGKSAVRPTRQRGGPRGCLRPGLIPTGCRHAATRSQRLPGPGAGLLVGFQGAIVRVLLRCFRDPPRVIRAIICEVSNAYSNPTRPRLLRTRSVFLFGQHVLAARRRPVGIKPGRNYPRAPDGKSAVRGAAERSVHN
jgi:hypothetical protein